jgi:hypothetical protein
MHISLQRLDPDRRVGAEFIRKVVIYAWWALRERDEERYTVIWNTWELFYTWHVKVLALNYRFLTDSSMPIWKYIIKYWSYFPFCIVKLPILCCMHKNIHIIYKVPNYLRDWCLGFSMQLDKYFKKLPEKTQDCTMKQQVIIQTILSIQVTPQYSNGYSICTVDCMRQIQQFSEGNLHFICVNILHKWSACIHLIVPSHTS